MFSHNSFWVFFKLALSHLKVCTKLLQKLFWVSSKFILNFSHSFFWLHEKLHLYTIWTKKRHLTNRCNHYFHYWNDSKTSIYRNFFQSHITYSHSPFYKKSHWKFIQKKKKSEKASKGTERVQGVSWDLMKRQNINRSMFW